MGIGEIIGGLVVLILGFFGMNKFKNGKASKEWEESVDLVKGHEEHIQAHIDALAIEEEHRAQGKVILAAKLGREVTDEEVNDFLTDRYRNS